MEQRTMTHPIPPELLAQIEAHERLVIQPIAKNKFLDRKMLIYAK